MKSLALFVALLAFADTAFADLTDDVRCREIGFSKAAESRDAESFSSFIDDDARFVSNSVTSGPKAITEAWAGFFADDGPLIKWRPQFVEVLKDGKLALTRGPYRMIAKDPEGNTVEGWGTFNSIWRRQDDGEWKVVFDAGNPAGAAPSAEVQALLSEEDDCEE
jgi:ketosteroid isomerase-like protein